ncbi:DUF1707 domain-containing protein [Amycolatopsis sp. MEPSY49]|uniref:DUF1707 SHOCT-like domain-containing protein n=1 Tax=Amycolatopsis sp. MEPSY49 TaxID=3151600 RepID=UPI003EF81656
MTDSSDIRISDDERESALAALGTHMSSGRLDVDEFSERSAKAAIAKTRGDLILLFRDLPHPHPEFGAIDAPKVESATTPDVEPENQPATRRDSAVGRRLAKAAIPAVIVVAMAIFVLTHLWVLVVIPVATAVIGGIVWAALRTRGSGWADSSFDAEFDAEFDRHFNARHSVYDKDYSKNYTRNYLRNYMRKYNERYDRRDGD